MNTRRILAPLLSLGFSLLLSGQTTAAPTSHDVQGTNIVLEKHVLFDAARKRPVPVAVYTDPARKVIARPLAIISHGYGIPDTAYSFIANHLASNGYYVVAVQHDVPGDAPLPMSGNAYEDRKPSWERGVQDILFVVAALKESHTELDYAHLLLIGHSQGGDTSLLFAQEHAEMVYALISLDSRRMPFPRSNRPHILSLRSSDQQPDAGVIPNAEEQGRFGMEIVKLSDWVVLL